MPIFDAHCHAFPDAIAPDAIRALVNGAKWWTVRNYLDGSVSGLSAGMQSAGFTKALLYSVATRPTQVTRITEWSASIAAQYPGRIFPFASLHPDFEAPEREVERIAQLGLKGVKLHPQYQNCPADDARMVRIAQSAASCGLAVAIHGGYDPAFERTDVASPTRIRRLHDAVPGLRLLACHLGGFEQWEEVLEVIVGEDIYIDTTYSLGVIPETLLYRVLDRHDPKRVLFGTDSPWADLATEAARFEALAMTPEQKQLARWDNAHCFAALPATPMT